MPADFPLPVLSHFLNGNPWTAGDGRMRYRAAPDLPQEPEEAALVVQVWEGPWAREFSTIEEERRFPLTEDGLAALRQWLDAWRTDISGRPRRTMAEDLARRKAPAPDEA